MSTGSRELFEEEPLTFDFKWLRGIPRQAFTGTIRVSEGSDPDNKALL